MSRRRDPETAREKIADVIRWADQMGLRNIANQLRSALALMPEEPAERSKRRA